MIKFHSAVIFVSNIETSRLFYTNILEEEIEHDFGKNVILKSGLSLWELREDHIIAQNLNTDPNGHKIELYFEADNIEHITENLKENNIKFLHEMHEEPWGQQNIRFFDPDNHLIEIGEPLPIFINNMHNKGMTVEEIEQKSGVPAATIQSLLK